MSSRQVFAPVFATALIAITAALLHPVLDLSPPLDFKPGRQSAPPTESRTR